MDKPLNLEALHIPILRLKVPRGTHASNGHEDKPMCAVEARQKSQILGLGLGFSGFRV